MSGERNLDALIAHMAPQVRPGVFVFCTMPAHQELPAGVKPILLFREDEGTTVVLRQEEAERAGLPAEFPSRLITLGARSSLEAVGFLAAVTARLARADISVNAVSAFYHDHLFVPEHKADEALRQLQDLSARSGRPCAGR